MRRTKWPSRLDAPELVPGDVDLDRLWLVHPNLVRFQLRRLDCVTLGESSRPLDLVDVDDVVFRGGLYHAVDALRVVPKAHSEVASLEEEFLAGAGAHRIAGVHRGREDVRLASRPRDTVADVVTR